MAALEKPLEGLHDSYDLVVSNFCLDSAPTNHGQFVHFIQNVLSLLKPEGFLILSALEESRSYPVGDRTFLALPLTQVELGLMLVRAGCDPDSLVLSRVAAERPELGYQGLLFSCGRKLRPRSNGADLVNREDGHGLHQSLRSRSCFRGAGDSCTSA